MIRSDFIKLESERPIGSMGGIGAIPVTSMYSYLFLNSIPQEDWELHIALWREMDGVTLEHYAERMKRNAPKKPEAPKKAARRR